MSQVTAKGPVTPSMNITPLIDVVFLLIIFFMLVNNIIAEESAPLIVPTVDDSRAIDLSKVDRIVINVVPAPFDRAERMNPANNPLRHSPAAEYLKVGTRSYAMDAAGIKQATEELKARVDAFPKDENGQSKLEVLLRADAALSYSEVQPVMAMITAAGIGKVNLVTFVEEE